MSPGSFAFAAVAWLLRLLPRPLVVGMIHCASHILVPFLRRRLGIVRENLGSALGHDPQPATVRRLARRSLEHLALTFLDLVRLPILTRRRLRLRTRVVGIEHFLAARARGRGVVVVTAHLGGFEWIAPAFQARGFQAHLVGRALHNASADALLVGLRASHGVATITPFQSARAVLRRLRAGEGVGYALDQNARYASVFPRFFGRPASTLVAPAVMSRVSRAPVVPIFAVRDPDGRVNVYVQPPIPFDRTGPKTEAIEAHTAHYTACIEAAVRRWPEQWFWFHRRFKTRPESEGGTGGRRGSEYFRSRQRRHRAMRA